MSGLQGSSGPSGGRTLEGLRRGETARVVAVDDEAARVLAMRIGVAEGSRVSCVARIPKGPVVLRAGRQEIAVGRSLARRIRVEPSLREGAA